MCGIVCIIDQSQRDIPVHVLRTLRDLMISRGPDGAGEFLFPHGAIAMRRLSVIDPENGWQPLKSAEGKILAFQNGEIYNHGALRKELESCGYIFTTQSDTEVLAHGYAEWGIDGLLRRIDGMYSFAILDLRSRELHLARDRFGEKPLFYASADGKFACASDLRALAALPWIGDEIDSHGLQYYLALHYVPGERTILRNVKRVLPGERIRVRLDDPVPIRSRYYRPPIGSGEKITDDALAHALEQAVVSRLVADVPVGVFLSGGTDSSVVAAIAARFSPGIATFSIGFDSKDHDESPYARLVAGRIGSSHHHFMFDGDGFNRMLPVVAQALDEPVGDQALLPLYRLCEEARKHVTVVLSGDGADELFAGYHYYCRFAGRRTLQRLLKRWMSGTDGSWPARLIDNTEPITPSGFPLLSGVLDRMSFSGGVQDGPDQWESDLMAFLDKASDPLQRATVADIATWLPDDLLVKLDRMAMANSLEGRSPYLHPVVADIAVRGLAPSDRMVQAHSKVALRRLASRWLPREICDRPKQGFVLPMRRWIAAWLKNHGGPQDYFTRNPFPGLNMAKVAEKAGRDMNAGILNERLLFALILLCEWHGAFTRRIAELRRCILSG